MWLRFFKRLCNENNNSSLKDISSGIYFLKKVRNKTLPLLEIFIS